MLKEGKVSSKTLERVIICKSYIERKYSMKKKVIFYLHRMGIFVNQKLEETSLL
jgi:hypothetical protein